MENSQRNSLVEIKKNYSVRFWLIILLTTATWIVSVLWLHAENARLLPSWHGFLHSAISTRFPSGSIPPENPFFAGEKVPYYWVYHFIGFSVARVFQTDLLHAFQFISISSLAILVVFAGLIGHKYFKSSLVGIFIGYLAIAGLNPLGPAIATSKYLLQNKPLFRDISLENPAESVFVSNQMADDLMTHPLLGSMYLGNDWRHGQNLSWFLDISSRTPALSFIIVSIFFIFYRRKFIRNLSIIFISALITALNPIIGLATTGSTVGAFTITFIISKACKRKRINLTSEIEPLPFFIPISFFIGAVLALPTYYHLLLSNDGTVSLSSFGLALLKIKVLFTNFLILIPLVMLGIWKAPSQAKHELQVITITGLLLLFAVPVFHLEQGNEHNLSNAAQCLLAVPAVTWITCIASRKKGNYSKMVVLLLLLFIIFLPTTICTFFSFKGRPGLPLRYGNQILHRLPEKSALENLYAWIRKQTPKNAVFICNPNTPVKMSGNVSELPAFTSRTLFTDHASYLTIPYEDFTFRSKIAVDAISGRQLDLQKLKYLSHLQRPLYLLAYEANKKSLFDRLVILYGRPIFHQDFVAVFKFVLNEENL